LRKCTRRARKKELTIWKGGAMRQTTKGVGNAVNALGDLLKEWNWSDGCLLPPLEAA
tara:strand:+ start:395 stop:565 length:171 start_codon:yes stop_codon:yes gene_type:complete